MSGLGNDKRVEILDCIIINVVSQGKCKFTEEKVLRKIFGVYVKDKHILSAKSND